MIESNEPNKIKITPSKKFIDDKSPDHWSNRVLTWWSGFSLRTKLLAIACLLYTSDAADDLLCVDLGGRRIIKKLTTRVAIANSFVLKLKPLHQVKTLFDQWSGILSSINLFEGVSFILLGSLLSII